MHKHGPFANVFVTSVNGADSRSTNPLDGVDDLVASFFAWGAIRSFLGIPLSSNRTDEHTILDHCPVYSPNQYMILNSATNDFRILTK